MSENNFEANKVYGWVCDYRSIMQWQWYTCPLTAHLFMHCVRRANHTEGYFHGIRVPRGSFITSYESLSKETGLTVKQVRTALDKHLAATGELIKKATAKYTMITVANYDVYQAMHNNNSSG